MYYIYVNLILVFVDFEKKVLNVKMVDIDMY